ncbi:MAG: NFACT family protein [Anaerolineae bacterium]|nr:NFACT family protein [Anaerolineae bacterium]
MYLDALTLSALVDEFMDELVGGRVQDVLDVDNTGFGFEIYADRQRHYLYLSADKQVPHVHLVGDKLRRGLYRPTQLGLMLRRYIEGGILTHVSQPEWERILYLDFEHPAEGEARIIIEPMERRSNILLLDSDGIIRDCVHRVGPEDNRYRLSLPNHEYKLPPPLTDRYNPFTITEAQIQAILDASENPDKDKVVRLLPRKILGCSPLLAKEIVYRATGDISLRVSDADSAQLQEIVVDIMKPLKKREWQAGVAVDDEMIDAYAVYPLTHNGEWRRTESISAAMTEYYGAAVGEEAYNQGKKPVQEALNEAKAKYGAKLASLENSLKDQSEMNYLQQSGELILAYQYTIEPHQTELVAQYNVDEPALTIKINPELSPLENAQKYFDRYNRSKRARKNVPKLIAEARHEWDYILQLENDLKMAANWAEIDDVIQALQNRGYLIKNKKVKRLGGGGRTGPLKLTKDGYVIWVGRNSRQNEQVTFKTANADDFWLHARDVPGAHVVIRNDGRRIPDKLIEEIASIAAYYSSKREDTKVSVDITRCKYVKSIRGAGQGMVTYRNERTITVEPHNEEILKDD